ncbi:glutamyl-tRNA reductase [Phycisphaera mikurensis]|uniref:Glutamyl-tRNA reductase n=1 Tax=Phycisphaera mikurensis (strain NBRC 102666 / KCTC 22515 / FYK2301M01) TaxID=1142394 RepID=I0IDE2_PHYMF|nr:glutamyl-tRNA reductase [Phycisphaera mikurensis]MBB6443334.1 glutamyl-tRNA reductase [Phycisphaera mikurensis]BAM03280.1 glutamyl-tRNA reductase [Phycisphaera mikurensis NBRC 102666]
MTEIAALSMSHRNADLPLRERASVDAARASRLRAELAAATGELVVLSTCNRTELYATGSVGPSALRAAWSRASGVAEAELAGASCELAGGAAVRHLFRVAAGLESQVVGEPEILGQVKRAYENGRLAAASGACGAGPVMHRVFQRALAAAKSARSESGLSRRGGSVGSVAVTLARTVFQGFEGKEVLCVGAGAIAKATMRRFLRHRPARVRLVNRREDRAGELGARLGLPDPAAAAWPLERLEEALIAADVAVFATAATEPVLTEAALKPLLKRRRGRPLLILDLGLPRDVEPPVGKLPRVYLYNVDDLQEVVDHDPERRASIQACSLRVEAAAAACVADLTSPDPGPAIGRLRAQLHALAGEEETRTRARLTTLLGDRVDAATRAEVEAVLGEFRHRLVNKVLHGPVSRVRGEAPVGVGELEALFGLGEPPPPVAAPAGPAVAARGGLA